MNATNICDACGKHIRKRQVYCLKVELYAHPEVVLDAEDLAKDNKEEMQKLCARMKNADSKKLEEDVYVAYNLKLCKSCRDKFNQRLKCKEFI
ncbi:MAG: hypothetical protein KKB82_05110 [Candidatus Omnitrophica bacterium]|nr:hypothetical protein [Candidatus Omnitrophota bacterium]MBU1925284.1 hypothetical protein [Candidatus Omnitrophota bacterium]MBU2064128.1 hypothetical protein [Candidatus Omnitrophota bacterium]